MEDEWRALSLSLSLALSLSQPTSLPSSAARPFPREAVAVITNQPAISHIYACCVCCCIYPPWAIIPSHITAPLPLPARPLYIDVLLPPARRNLPCLGALSSPRPPAASSLCCTGFPSLPPWDPIPHSFTLSFPNTCTIRSLYSLTLSSLALFLPPSHPSPLLFSPSLVPAIPLSSTHELLPFVAFLIAFTPLRSPSTQPLPRYFL